jgi:hypothetical protein
LNNNLESPLKRWLVKKRHAVSVSAISNFFGAIDLYKKNVQYNFFHKTIIGNPNFSKSLYCTLFFVRIFCNHYKFGFPKTIYPFNLLRVIGRKSLVMQLCLCVIFPFRKTFNQEVLLDLVEKTKQTCLTNLSIM